VESNTEALRTLKGSSIPPIDEIKKIKREIKIVKIKIDYIKQQMKTFEEIISDRSEELSKNQRQLEQMIYSAINSKVVSYEDFKSRRNK
jgi:hypothetical protein